MAQQGVPLGWLLGGCPSANRPNSLRMAEFAYRSELAQRTPVHAAAHCPREAATPAAAPRPTPPPAGAHVCRNDRYELCGCCDFAGPPAPATVVAVMVARAGGFC